MTIAATLVVTCSARWTEPAPSLDVFEVALSSLSAAIPAAFTPALLSSPKAFGRPNPSVFERERLVSLLRLALSVTFTFTVTRSPMRAARWSLKKAREPVRQREFGA
ncbi:hypothetical protein AEGHOMDF_5369 [Methylobacterium soli]|nr:hypothetical protein AEGHOMDF_5369 [Methylobacterium soli]